MPIPKIDDESGLFATGWNDLSGNWETLENLKPVGVVKVAPVVIEEVEVVEPVYVEISIPAAF